MWYFEIYFEYEKHITVKTRIFESDSHTELCYDRQSKYIDINISDFMD